MNVEPLGLQWMFLMVEELTIIDKPQAFSFFSQSFLGKP
jgi:hypothetical protein